VIFQNFTVDSEIHLRAFDSGWDLHSFAKFRGVRVLPDGTTVLTWVAPDEHPWGDHDATYRRCDLCFEQITILDITKKNLDVPLSENQTLSEIAVDDRRPMRPLSSADFFLTFWFLGGLTIRIAAAVARLQPFHDRDQREASGGNP